MKNVIALGLLACAALNVNATELKTVEDLHGERVCQEEMFAAVDAGKVHDKYQEMDVMYACGRRLQDKQVEQLGWKGVAEQLAEPYCALHPEMYKLSCSWALDDVKVELNKVWDNSKQRQEFIEVTLFRGQMEMQEQKLKAERKAKAQMQEEELNKRHAIAMEAIRQLNAQKAQPAPAQASAKVYGIMDVLTNTQLKSQLVQCEAQPSGCPHYYTDAR